MYLQEKYTENNRKRKNKPSFFLYASSFHAPPTSRWKQQEKQEAEKKGQAEKECEDIRLSS